MHSRFAPGTKKPSSGLIIRLSRLLVLFLPVALLLAVIWRSSVPGQLLWLGVGLQLLVSLIALYASRFGREPIGPAVIMLYVLALSWLILGSASQSDWMMHLAQAFLLVVPMVFFAMQCLRDSGATAMRRARMLAARLSTRKDWPTNLMQCRHLPEVKALRESLHVDASPALDLLANPRPAVRVAALAALEFRPTWRSGQPQLVLQLARRSPEPEVRAAAANALGNTDDRIIIESLAELLRDSSPLVRQTATEAILWNTDQRWHWIRDAVRHSLADSSCEEDGGLKLNGYQLTKEAIADLHSWVAEKGSIAQRAALTLGIHYGQLLSAGSTPELLADLRKYLSEPGTPTPLRLELARVMAQYHELNEEDKRRLLESTMPAPVRLIAIEAMMSEGPCPEAVAALHELARLPNREIGLAVADVVQRRLGIELGLNRDQGFPPIHSRTAAEVARRVQAWAAQHAVYDATAAQASDQRRWRSSSRIDL